MWPAGSLCTRLSNARRCPAVVRRHFKYDEVDIIKRSCSSLPLSPAWARGPALLVLPSRTALPSRTLAAECRGRWTGSCVPSTSAFAHAPTLIRVDAGARSQWAAAVLRIRVGSRHGTGTAATAPGRAREHGGPPRVQVVAGNATAVSARHSRAAAAAFLRAQLASERECQCARQGSRKAPPWP